MNTAINLQQKLEALALRLEEETIARLILSDLDCHANIVNARASVKIGRVYAKIDDRNSGRFMVEIATGTIYGIKAYGKVNKIRNYGTLDTIDQWDWSSYRPSPIIG